MLDSIIGVIFAMTKLKSHWVMSDRARMRLRRLLGEHSALRTKGMGPQPKE